MIIPQMAPPIFLSDKQKQHLIKLANGTHSKLHHKERAQYILYANEGLNNTAIASKENCNRKTVRKWRDRWNKAAKEIDYIEREEPHNLKSFIAKVLEDDYRPGCPPKFSAEQVAEIISLACESPITLNLPFTHWSNSLLAKEAIKRGIVDSISPRQVGRFLNEIDLKPHLYKGWLNPNFDDEDEFKKQVERICNIYKNAPEFVKDGIYVFGTDEMSGVQATEHCSPTIPARPGFIERCEQEYIKHGRTGLIATRDVVTGQIISPLIQPTRTEVDFVQHIKDVVELNPHANYIFIVDQLNTHKSESLVNFVIEQCQLDIDEKTLGVKGISGILKSMDTRAEFLSDSSHRISFVYSPKHSSWLNQIEIWFSILVRRILNRRASFSSVRDLEERIAQFIDYYNEELAKPFRWTYEGKLLKA